jgi:transposase-like protein
MNLVELVQFKCYGCGKEWSIRKDSMLEGLKVPLTKFIMAVKPFILEVPVNKAYKELELAYNTTRKMDNRIRQLVKLFPKPGATGFSCEKNLRIEKGGEK